MKIHFLGLSAFLIENKKGFRVLVDPFNDAPEWSLGPKFPKKFKGKALGANLVLMTEPDADHAYAPGNLLHNAPKTKPNSNPFPDLNLRGTVVYEYNGDLNVAWHYTIDGLRLAHFGDNSYVFTKEQLKEIGHPDIIFISPPKVDNKAVLDLTRKNIEQLKPKVVIWAHHLAPKKLPKANDVAALRKFFVKYFKDNASTSKGYTGEKSFMELCYILEHAIELNKEYSGITLNKPFLEINEKSIKQIKNRPLCVLFRSMLSDC
ncbi:MAG: MBL fold metallo-hydrolase [Patescibacteria group bacterium]|nr:MBL fold metallo-hydrolase [Patescibacteria group bacterium]